MARGDPRLPPIQLAMFWHWVLPITQLIIVLTAQRRQSQACSGNLDGSVNQTEMVKIQLVAWTHFDSHAESTLCHIPTRHLEA
jgi:hypothetical protein